MSNAIFNLGESSNSSLNFTTEQQDIIDSPYNSILVNAVAGSGKTSVLMEVAKKSTNGLYLAFNKAIVNDVVARLPVGWSCKTFNSLGLGLVKQKYPKIKVDFRKYTRTGSSVGILAEKHMIMGGNASPESWKATCRRFNSLEALVPDAKKFLTEKLADTTKCSGDEMLEYPIRGGWQTPKYDMVLVDECQDLNPQQIKFLSCIPTNKIVFVGDVNQAIYGFRGSDPEAIELIKKQYAPKQYPMNQSFRCPTEILNKVHHIVPHINSQKTGGEIQSLAAHEANYPDDCFVISRTNASLIKLAHIFISKREKFSIGSVFVNTMKNSMEPVMRRCSTIEDVRLQIESNFARELNRYEKNHWNTSTMIDRYKGMIEIAKQCNSIKGIKEFIKSMRLHEDSSSRRKLMTIHASKGLENEHVFFINPDVCDYFKQRTSIQWERQQEDNLYYVACTRALKKLTLVR